MTRARMASSYASSKVAAVTGSSSQGARMLTPSGVTSTIISSESSGSSYQSLDLLSGANT